MPEISLPDGARPHVLVEAGRSRVLGDLNPDQIIALYQAHGALLLRGFEMDVPQFHAFASQFCSTSVHNESPNRMVLDDAANIQSVDFGTEPFPLHPELSREPWKPDVCFFGCLNPPREAGATTICDGVDLVRQMPDALRAALIDRRLLYILPCAPPILQYWLGTAQPTDDELKNPPPHCPYRFVRNSARILRVFSRPALHKPMFTDEPAFGNFLLFARYHNGNDRFPVLDDGKPVPMAWTDAVRDLGDRLSVPIQWRQGDLLMLDNSRFMHGRTAVVDPQDRLIATYFGYLRFAIPDPEEPTNAIWRRTIFHPPQVQPPPAAAQDR